MKTMSEQEIKKLTGLSDSQVRSRLNAYGYNQITAANKRNGLKIILEISKEPMFILLLICALLYFVLGDLAEALILLFFVILIMLLTIVQEVKSEKTIAVLKDLSSPRALVIRNSKPIKIPAKEVVIDDLILLNEGDRVVADAKLLWLSNFMVDESLLTGESIVVMKNLAAVTDINMTQVYASTVVVQGQALARVTSTGDNTEIGKVGHIVTKITPETSFLQS